MAFLLVDTKCINIINISLAEIAFKSFIHSPLTDIKSATTVGPDYSEVLFARIVFYFQVVFHFKVDTLKGLLKSFSIALNME